jgi:hypothetical protein
MWRTLQRAASERVPTPSAFEKKQNQQLRQHYERNNIESGSLFRVDSE